MFCIVVVFFFKQKTAYEMRISDWSSDVCSSDLRKRRKKSPHPIRIWRRTWRSTRTLTTQRKKWIWVATTIWASPAATRKKKAEAAFFQTCTECAQIGRASCRERVCQYV